MKQPWVEESYVTLLASRQPWPMTAQVGEYVSLKVSGRITSAVDKPITAAPPHHCAWCGHPQEDHDPECKPEVGVCLCESYRIPERGTRRLHKMLVVVIEPDPSA